jgi:hypothetical protein
VIEGLAANNCNDCNIGTRKLGMSLRLRTQIVTILLVFVGIILSLLSMRNCINLSLESSRE